MNSKLIFLILLCLFFSSCGVKKPPIAPGNPTPSIIDSYEFEKKNKKKK